VELTASKLSVALKGAEAPLVGGALHKVVVGRSVCPVDEFFVLALLVNAVALVDLFRCYCLAMLFFVNVCG